MFQVDRLLYHVEIYSILKGHPNFSPIFFNLKLKTHQIVIYKKRDREKEKNKSTNKKKIEDDDADNIKMKKKKREQKVMKQQNRMKRCSEWMIGGPRCL